MAPPKDAKAAGPVGAAIETPEQWAAVYGEAATKDMLCVIEVYVSWCGPSDAIHSTFKRMLHEYEGKKLRIHSVNAELTEDLAKYRGTSKPHFLVLKDGDQIEVIEGVNAPALGKSVADHIPEGMLDIEDEKDEEGADEDGDDY